MERGERRALGACLCALYLPGGPGGSAPRAAWPKAAATLSRLPFAGLGSQDAVSGNRAGLGPGPSCGAGPGVGAVASGLGGAAQALRRQGLWLEASILDDTAVLAAACRLIDAGRVLTLADQEWPLRWEQVLGFAMPPALWLAGSRQPAVRPLAVAGSRQPDRLGLAAAQTASAAALAEGHTLVTGGAWGVDRAALDAFSDAWAPRAIVLHPCGLDTPAAAARIARWPWAMHLSACPPSAPFSTGGAMERNTLIYASAEGALAVGPRMRQGGTWHGAATALRRRLTRVAVAMGCGEAPAEAALCALGAWPLQLGAKGQGALPQADTLAAARRQLREWLASPPPGGGAQGVLFEPLDDVRYGGCPTPWAALGGRSFAQASQAAAQPSLGF